MLMKKTRAIPLAISFILGTLLFSLPTLAAEGVNVRLDSEETVSDVFTVGVVLENVENFDVATLNVVYDKTHIELTGATAGSLVPETSSAMLNPKFDLVLINVPGVEGASGTGSIVDLEFKSLKTGSSEVNLVNVSLVSSGGSKIPALSVTPVTVTTTEVAPSFEDICDDSVDNDDDGLVDCDDSDCESYPDCFVEEVVAETPVQERVDVGAGPEEAISPEAPAAEGVIEEPETKEVKATISAEKKAGGLLSNKGLLFGIVTGIILVVVVISVTVFHVQDRFLKKKEAMDVTAEKKKSVGTAPAAPAAKTPENAPNPEVHTSTHLEEYVKECISKGYTKDQVRGVLLQQNWDQSMVDAALKEYGK